MSVAELMKNKDCRVHHTASRRGYESRKSQGRVEPYNGKYGYGYILITPRYDTTRYVSVTYYIAS